MSVESAVVAKLKATSAVTALVSTRIYLLKLPQKPTLPAIRVQLISDPQNKHLRGPDGATRARIQVDAYAAETVTDPYGSVDNISEAVNDALVYEGFTAASIKVQSAERVDRRAMREADELNLVRMLQDFQVWSKPTS